MDVTIVMVYVNVDVKILKNNDGEYIMINNSIKQAYFSRHFF